MKTRAALRPFPDDLDMAFFHAHFTQPLVTLGLLGLQQMGAIRLPAPQEHASAMLLLAIEANPR